MEDALTLQTMHSGDERNCGTKDKKGGTMNQRVGKDTRKTNEDRQDWMNLTQFKETGWLMWIIIVLFIIWLKHETEILATE